MSRILTLVLLFSAVSAASFEGRIVDGDGQPVVGATVSILGYPGAVRSDAEGRFEWSPDPALPFDIFVTLPGGTYMAPVHIEGWPAAGPVEVVVLPLVSESVSVTSGAAPSIDAPPASATTAIPREEIQSRHPARLTDVVATLAGAGSLSDLHASVPSLRGLARGRTLLLIDGARVTSERRAGPSATFIDPFFLEGVEVSRGPGSVGYGSDAFGGVIHARTRRIEAGAPTRVRLRGAFGAGLPEATGGVELTHGLEEGGVVLQARYRNFESYRSPDGEVFNSQASDRGLLGRFGHRVGSGTFEAGWQTSLARDTGRPDSRGEAVQTRYPEENSHRLTMSYDLDPRAGFTRLGLHGFWGRYRLVTETIVPEEESTRAADVVANDFSFRSFGVRPVGRARWEMGLDVNGRYGLHALDLSTVGELPPSESVAVESAGRFDAGLYTSVDVLLGSSWSLGAGLRLDRVTTDNRGGFFDDLSTANTALSGYGSLKVELAEGLSLTGQLARGFRDPTLSDRYFRGISGRGVVTGNPGLEPETANQADVALRYRLGPLTLSTFGYFYRFSELIERYEVAPDDFTFRNRGAADIRGLELEAQAVLPAAFTLDLAATLARGSVRGEGASVDDIPGPNLKLGLRRTLTDKGYGQIRVAFFSTDERPGPTEIVVPRYQSFDVSGGFRVSPNLELRGLVRNLFDQRFPVSPDARAVLAPGISGVFTVVAEF